MRSALMAVFAHLVLLLFKAALAGCDSKPKAATAHCRVTGAFAQSSEIYSFLGDLVLPAWAHTHLQGFPRSYDWEWAGVEHKRARAQRSLAGEAYTYPVMATALFCAFLTEKAPWWQQDL